MIRSLLHEGTMRQRLTGGVALAMMLAPVAAWAQEEALIARSSAKHIEVYAAGGAQWCRKDLRLKMVLSSESGDMGNPTAQVALLDRMRREFEQTCPTAERADASVSEEGRITGQYHAERSGGWVFAAAPPPAATPPASLDAPTPPNPFTGPPPADAPAPQPAADAATAPQATPPATSPAPDQAQPAVASAQPAPVPKVGDQGYWGYMLFAGKNDPTFLANPEAQKCWAQGHMASEWFRSRNDDFRLHEVLEKAGQDMQAHSGNVAPGVIYAELETEFGHYDFQENMFPVHINGNLLRLGRPCAADGIPLAVALHAQDMESITGFAMPPEEARNFERRRESFGWMNRRVWIVLEFDVDPRGVSGNEAEPTYSATVHGYSVYGDQRLETLLYQAGPEQIAAQHAQAQRIAAARREKQLVARRDSEIRELGTTPVPVRLANWINDDRPVELFHSLDNIRATRFASMQGDGKPVPVSLLVQTNGSGHKDVATAWPGHLSLTMADDKADFGDAGWYLVSCMLTTPTQGDFPDAQLSVTRSYACKQPQCADATDPTEIENRKIANATQAATSTPAP
ncbi:DUF4852 domain-containing protein [Gluconacetobacter entanii]|nr:DUF4852 domain-containing protein [Gluconacetobacter entanii]